MAGIIRYEKKLKAFLQMLLKDVVSNYQLYLMLLIPITYIIIFHYVPLFGAQIAFRKFNAVGGITGYNVPINHDTDL